MKRMRGRNHRPNNGGGGGGGGFSRNQQNGIPLNRNHVFDSSGPEMRVRGTAQQLFDKYTQMARDAASSGDRVLGESYYQHAEHYFRIISAINQAQGLPNPPQNGQPGYAGETEGEQPRAEVRQENRQEQQPRQDNQNRQEYRQDRPERSENRDNNRQQDNRENRNDGNRQDRPRFEQRPRPEFQQRDPQRERGDRPYRQPQPPIAEAPIDISSALEAELAAAVAQPPGLSEQPQIKHEITHEIQRAIQHELLIPPAPAPTPAPEPRAIPIITEAPPPVAEEPAAAAPIRRPRGRPKLVKAETPSE